LCYALPRQSKTVNGKKKCLYPVFVFFTYFVSLKHPLSIGPRRTERVRTVEEYHLLFTKDPTGAPFSGVCTVGLLTIFLTPRCPLFVSLAPSLVSVHLHVLEAHTTSTAPFLILCLCVWVERGSSAGQYICLWFVFPSIRICHFF